LLKWHGKKDEVLGSLNLPADASEKDEKDALKAYWKEWEKACPYVRGKDCCDPDLGNCCGDGPWADKPPSSPTSPDSSLEAEDNTPDPEFPTANKGVCIDAEGEPAKGQRIKIWNEKKLWKESKKRECFSKCDKYNKLYPGSTAACEMIWQDKGHKSSSSSKSKSKSKSRSKSHSHSLSSLSSKDERRRLSSSSSDDDPYSPGCYVIKGEVAAGNGANLAKCYFHKDLEKPATRSCTDCDTAPVAPDDFAEPQLGFCTLPTGNKPRAGEKKKIMAGNFETEEEKKTCLEMCNALEGVTACETRHSMQWRGCFAHFAPIQGGNGKHFNHKNKVSCYVRPNPGMCVEASGGLWGDPHFTTYDKLKYNCQGQGEFVISKSKTDPNFEVRGLFVSGNNLSKRTSVTRAVSFVGSDTVPVIQTTLPDVHASGDDKCPFSFHVDGTSVPGDVGALKTYLDSKGFADEVKVTKIGKFIQFYFPTKNIEVRVSPRESKSNGCVVTTYVCVTPENVGGKEQITGLLGLPNNDKKDDFQLKNGGPPIDVPVGNASKEKVRLRNKLSEEWCVKNWCVLEASESMIVQPNGKTFNDYNKCNGPAGEVIDVTNPPEKCKEICDNSVEECVECIEFGKEEAEREENTAGDPNDGIGPELQPVEECKMDIEKTKNPDCTSDPVAVFKPTPEYGPGTPMYDLLYDFVFDPSGKSISFKVWEDIGQDDPEQVDVYVEYDKPHNTDYLAGDWTCDKVIPECLDVAGTTAQEGLKYITAVCPHQDMHGRKFAMVTLSYILRGEEDSEFLPSDGISDCCHADLDGDDDIIDPVQKYSYKVYCECPKGPEIARLRA
jgi:hypothetical protein